MNDAEVLAGVNRVRNALGLEKLSELPRGQRERPTQCPLARGFNKGCSVSGRTVRFRSIADAKAVGRLSGWEQIFADGTRVRAPHWVYDFVTAFDRGGLPQYEEQP